ncbi:MAG: DNA polymerase III subunit delta [Bacteroidia bacterium]|nr:DNA polymerase III subunit delta [Bacteroidia bacterium]
MAKNTEEDFKLLSNSIKNREFQPVYFLSGDEPYYIEKISDLIEETVLTPTEKQFNQTIMYGKEVKVKDIVMAAKRYPMMAEYQVIIVKEAQNLPKNQMDDFVPYLENPLKSTILVLNYKIDKLDQRTKVAKLFLKYGFFKSEKLYENKIPGWIEKYIRSLDKAIDSQASLLIAEYLGNDLGKIANEIDKMLLQLPKEVQLINTKHVEENIGISKDFNVFELQKAIGSNNFNKSIQIINYLANNPTQNPFIVIIGNLFSYFKKILLYHEFKTLDARSLASKLGIHEFILTEYRMAAANFSSEKVEQVFAILKYYDLKSKGVGGNATPTGEMMREMVLKIFATHSN